MHARFGPFFVAIYKFTNPSEIKKQINLVKKSRTKRQKNFFFFLYSLCIILRLLTGFLVFLNPLAFFIAYLVIDYIDFIPCINWNFKRMVYQKIDKALDYYAYVFMVLYSATTPYSIIMLLLLLHRGLGLLLFYLTNKKKYLFLFPNLIEPFFAAILFSNFTKIDPRIIFFGLLPLKFIQEKYLHLNKENILRVVEFGFNRNKIRIITTEIKSFSLE